MTGPCTLNAFSVLADNDRRKEGKKKGEQNITGKREKDLQQSASDLRRGGRQVCALHSTYVLPMPHFLINTGCRPGNVRYCKVFMIYRVRHELLVERLVIRCRCICITLYISQID